MIRDFIKGRKQALASAETPVGLGGFRMFARVSDSTNYKASVPSTYLEDGSAAADHIVRDLLTLTINGEVTDDHIELAPVNETFAALDTVVGQISAFLPNRTQAQINRVRTIGQSVMDAVDKVDRVINIGRDAYNALSGAGATGKPLREQFVDFIESVYYGNQLIDVDAAYRTHSRMAITDLIINRDNERESLRFEITLQQVPVTKLITVDISEFYQAPAPGQTGDSVSGAVDQGAQEAGAGRTRSLASAIFGR